MSVKTITLYAVVCDQCGYVGDQGISEDEAIGYAEREGGWIALRPGTHVCDSCRRRAGGEIPVTVVATGNSQPSVVQFMGVRRDGDVTVYGEYLPDITTYREGNA